MGLNAMVSADYPDHRKTHHLMELIGHEADCYPIRMWCWARRFALAGRFRSTQELERVACRWRGDAGQLAHALVTAGFLEPDGLTIHDWADSTGGLARRYEVKKMADRDRWRSSHLPRGELAASTPIVHSYPPSPSPSPPPSGVVAPARASPSASTGSDGIYHAAWLEYRMAHGMSPEDSFSRAVDAAVAAGVPLPAFVDWHRANPGRQAWEANRALVAPPARPLAQKPRDALDKAIEQRKGKT